MTEEQAIELLAKLTAIEGMLSVIIALIFIAFIYKICKLCSRFLDMFF